MERICWERQETEVRLTAAISQSYFADIQFPLLRSAVQRILGLACIRATDAGHFSWLRNSYLRHGHPEIIEETLWNAEFDTDADFPLMRTPLARRWLVPPRIATKTHQNAPSGGLSGIPSPSGVIQTPPCCVS